MVVRKQSKIQNKSYTMFINYSGGSTINMSAAARDFILPRRYLIIEVEDSANGKFVTLTPTEDKDGYKLCLSDSGQAKFSYQYMKRFCVIPANKRIPLADKNGKLVFFVPKTEVHK